MLEVGMEVEVNSQFISGTGTIIDISNAAYYSVQVEMDNSDVDGHRIFRFHPEEVRKQTSKAVPIREHTVELIKLMRGYSLKLGECFTARPTKSNKGTHFLIYSGDKIRGCFPVSHFRTVTLTDVIQRTKRPKQEDLKEVKDKVKKLNEQASQQRPSRAAVDEGKESLIENNMKNECQISIFEFI